MNLHPPEFSHAHRPAPSVRGSILVIVLWISFGLVAITLYFAQAMSLELRAADNRVAALAADQAIEGAACYVACVLTNLATNGFVPDPTSYQSEAVPVGDAHFWLIGRPDPLQAQQGLPNRIAFGLVDEASKLNLNTTAFTNLQYLPRITQDFAAAIVDWRDTDDTPLQGGAESQVYSMQHPSYLCKSTNFETIDELRLVYGANLEMLLGEDVNRNGVLDPSENDDNRNNLVDPGLLEYVTVYSSEPNTYSNGLARASLAPVESSGPLSSLLTATFSAARVQQILNNLGVGASANAPMGGNQGSSGTANTSLSATFASPLAFYRKSKMTAEEFALIANSITVTNASNILGRVNVNTASAAVLACLPGLTPELAQQLVSYRQANPNNTASIAWIKDALGDNNAAVLDLLEKGDYLTTQSFQYTADIAAVGPYGRGYRRMRYVFDTSDGTARVVYRQDLSHLGWALGREARETWVQAKRIR